MKKFFKDYWKLCKDSGEFYKEHWKGCIVLNVIVIGAEFAYVFKDDIKDTLKEKFNREES